MPVFIGISVIVFGLMAATPGDPISITMGEKADPVVVARVRHELGLDRPLLEQYLRYVWNAAHGDFGTSFYYRDRSVASIVGWISDQERETPPPMTNISGSSPFVRLIRAIPM